MNNVKQFCIAVTDKCNSKCSMCDVWKRKPKDEFTLDDLEKFLEKNIFPQLNNVSISGGEPALRKDIVELVKLIHQSRHLTTMFVTHDLSCLPITCDRVVLMKDGLIWGEGLPEELLTDDNLSQLYDMPTSVVRQRREEVTLV